MLMCVAAGKGLESEENTCIAFILSSSYDGTHMKARLGAKTTASGFHKAKTLLCCCSLQGRCVKCIAADSTPTKIGSKIVVGVYCSCTARRGDAQSRDKNQLRHFERPQHMPRSSAGAQTCVAITYGPPACPASRSARKDRRALEKSVEMPFKTIWCLLIVI